MPDKEAARITADRIRCSLQVPATPPVPHDPTGQGLPILAPGSSDVTIGNLAAAAIGCQSPCPPPPVGIPNKIISGAMLVLINNKPAVRNGDRAAHGGAICGGCSSVLIGGPSCSGNPALGKEECEKAAAGRHSGRTQQSYENCSIESCRQIINRRNNSNVSEDTLLDEAMGNPASYPSGHLANRKATRRASGGAVAWQNVRLLRSRGVGASRTAQTMDNIKQSVNNGKGVIAGVRSPWIYGPHLGPPRPQGGHAVLVTGLQYDDNGNVTAVIVNDTGSPSRNCMQAIDAAHFERCLDNDDLVVTDDPLW